MIPEKEIKIFERINYADKYLHIRQKYAGNGESKWLFNKSDVTEAIRELGYNAKYIDGGAYIIERIYKNYLFEYRFVISKNNFNTYLNIFIDNELCQERISNIGSVLRYIPFNVELVQKLNSAGFVLNTKDALKNYIKDIIELLDEFVNEYK